LTGVSRDLFREGKNINPFAFLCSSGQRDRLALGIKISEDRDSKCPNVETTNSEKKQAQMN
jgi:hypothetical protein